MAESAKPAVVLARRPAAERAPGARAGRTEAFLLLNLAIQDTGEFRGVIRGRGLQRSDYGRCTSRHLLFFRALGERDHRYVLSLRSAGSAYLMESAP
jgi:hypothetical protein